MATGLHDYLALVNSHVQKLEAEDEIRLTVGNESCDLDSIVSALCHAYYLTLHNPSQSPCLPLVQCSRADFSLRTEAVWLFSKLKLDPAHLVYLDDDIIGRLKQLKRVSVTLVDHNTLTGPLLELSNLEILSIIDHHHPPPPSFPPPGPGPYMVEPVGSCATLVAEIFHDNIPSTVATLLLGAILLDTVGLDRSTGRVHDRDVAMAERLKPLSEIPSTDLYSSLSSERLSAISLTSLQLLRKDMKVVKGGTQRIGFSSLTCKLSSDLLDARQDCQEAVESVMKSHNLAVLVVLGISVREGVAEREIAVFQRDQASDVADAVSSVLENEEDLKCVRIPHHLCILLKQGNSSRSRKHILPLVTNFFSSLDDHKTMRELETTVVDQKKETELIPEYSYEEEIKEIRSHRVVDLKDQTSPTIVDMNIISPYKKIIQHGGYVGTERQAVLVISACYLPPRSLPDYDSTANQLFLYVVSVVQRLIVDNYQIVYLHSGAPQHSMPSLSILKQFYQLLDHRLKKQLQHLYIVHPTFWVRSMLQLARPFISAKFYRKVHLVRRLDQLPVALEHSLIPAPVHRHDLHSPHRNPQPSQRYTPTNQEDTPSSPSHQEGGPNNSSQQEDTPSSPSHQEDTPSTPTNQEDNEKLSN